ncbi:glycosyltransferase [Halomonas sp. YLB-10]|uniref:glycosyltransferase n=1 Tax=Halomonas sp. YLB-10 TaxID=2483111 RepID=UPI000F5F8683|nr:glycosyltransferase [Halomonas sp. YLB-10]RQW70915.1 glycosyltransferase [Halomonas sp. YLB-10]
MSVYYKENPDYLHSSLRSVWDDQELKPDQIVIVKDGPLTSPLNDVLGEWEERLGESLFTVLAIERNVGLAEALNKGIEVCRYDLIARMDTDDISLPTRFLKQINFMEKAQNVDVSSCFIEERGEDLKDVYGIREIPVGHEEILNFSRKRSPINHPASVFRKSSVVESGGYPDKYPEDYALWVRMLFLGYRFANFPEVLLMMRTGDGFYERRGKKFLKGELSIILMQKKYNMISWFGFFRNVMIRCVLRLSPAWVKKIAYKLAR